MIYISFVQLLAGSFEVLSETLGEIKGSWIAVVSFFAGMLLISLIDKLVPSFDYLHKTNEIFNSSHQESSTDNVGKGKLLRAGVLTTLAIAVHNFPEGIAGIMVFISFDQILPTARDYGEHHLTVYGLVSGMVVMALSLLLFI